MSIGSTIKFYRKGLDLTQSQLAEIIGVSTQAISKWETDAGMPDISQIVPLAIALNVSTDVLLGLNKDNEDAEIALLKDKIGHYGVDISSTEAEKIYSLSCPAFKKHPTNPQLAFWCLESLSVLLPLKLETENKYDLLNECTRYHNCISRYETDADMLFKSYYVMARCYKQLGEDVRTDEIMERIPSIFGDRAYWEAEFAYAENNIDLPIEKCKLSFHDKARYISRCIRLMRMISEDIDGKDGIEHQVELNEYMLTLINAFLSGGKYLPHRMVYQKMALLSGMISQYINLDNPCKAVKCMKELLEIRDNYAEFMKAPDTKHCLMFPEGDDDGIWNVTPEWIESRINNSWAKLSNYDKAFSLNEYAELKAKF